MLSSALDQLEARLQSLIEGSAARLFPAGKPTAELAHRLVAAMRAGIKFEPGGEAMAPNRFTIYMNPVQASPFRNNQAFLDELADLLQETCARASLHFYGYPSIVVAAEANIPPGEMHIQAEMVATTTGDTERVSLSEEEAVPEGTSEIAIEGFFLIVNNSEIFPLTQPVINIGRSSDNHLVIDDVRVSRYHAQMRFFQGRYVLSDLNSTGGTFVNRQRIHQRVLKPGDVVSLAGVPLVFGQDKEQDTGPIHRGDMSAPQAYEPP